MAKCLRCGAGNEWIQGKVPDEPEVCDAAVKEIDTLRRQLEFAQEIVSKGVEIMPLDKLGQWESVRTFQETTANILGEHDV